MRVLAITACIAIQYIDVVVVPSHGHTVDDDDDSDDEQRAAIAATQANAHRLPIEKENEQKPSDRRR